MSIAIRMHDAASCRGKCIFHQIIFVIGTTHLMSGYLESKASFAIVIIGVLCVKQTGIDFLLAVYFASISRIVIHTNRDTYES